MPFTKTLPPNVFLMPVTYHAWGDFATILRGPGRSQKFVTRPPWVPPQCRCRCVRHPKPTCGETALERGVSLHCFVYKCGSQPIQENHRDRTAWCTAPPFWAQELQNLTVPGTQRVFLKVPGICDSQTLRNMQIMVGTICSSPGPFNSRQVKQWYEPHIHSNTAATGK